MSRQSRLEQTTLADEIERQRNMVIAIPKQKQEGRVRNLVEAFGIGLLVSTVFRGIF
jgi:hypothetical protein